MKFLSSERRFQIDTCFQVTSVSKFCFQLRNKINLGARINLEISLLSWKLHYEPSDITNVSKLTITNILHLILKTLKKNRDGLIPRVNLE